MVNKKYSLYGLDWHLRFRPLCSTWLIFADWASTRLLIRGNCCGWLNFSDSLSTYQAGIVPLERISQTICLLIGGTCLLFSDKLSPRRGTYLVTLSDVTYKHERNDWQLLLWLVFPFKVSLIFYGWTFLLWNFLDFSRNWGIQYKNIC